MVHITSTGAVTVGSSPRGLRINFNAALTGTVTIADTTGTLGIVTNPTAQSYWQGYGFTGATTINASATPEMSVSILNTRP